MKTTIFILNMILGFITVFFVIDYIFNYDFDFSLGFAIISHSIMLANIIGSFGEKRQIGFTGAFFASLFFTQLFAMLFVLASDKK